MCGITGFIDRAGIRLERDSSKIIEQMTNTLHHRGPDGGSTQLLELDEIQIGLGHRRLAIIDLTDHGKQPMQFCDLWITFNGEIYNYQEIKQELTKLGHSFTGNSDTEMILHAFAQWGEKCLDRFIGMFAFVLINTKEQTAFAARDRAGVKPFFYYQNDGLFLYSSELKAFHEHPDFKKEIDPSAVAAFMQYGNVPTPHCIFKNCLKLKPGHFLKFDLKSNRIETQQYWNVYDSYNKPKLDISFSEALDKTENLLTSAFNYRMVADVPVGVFLSGGYDSVSVTALLQKDRSEKLKTFTIAVPDIGLNEAPFAKELADHIGTDHTEIICSQKDAIDLIPNLPFYYDEPFGDSSAIPTTLVSLMARKHVTVALSADGGDEIFAGYNRYDYLMRHGKKIANLPSPIRRTMAGMMEMIPADRIPVLKNKYNFHNRYEKLKGILRDPSPEKIMQSLTWQFEPDRLKELMTQEFDLLETAYSSQELKKEYYTPLSYMMAIDYTTYMVDDILQKVDRATMTASLEGREPFMDQRIIEFAAQLPDDYKYHNGIKKYILREVVHRHVPKEMMDRPKMGFAIPIADWLRTDLRDLLETYLSEERIKKEGFFNWEYVLKLKTQFLLGKKEYDLKIWYLLMFEMWMEKWGE
jgi:asparagine synthase (glutamine-hydrolysing)